MAISHENDADAFHAFERTGWESNVAAYDAAFARLTRQAIGPLLEAVSMRPGTRRLDVATGPGYVAAAAVSRGAAATGIDFSAPMIARARELHPDVEFREGDAEALAFADAAFDAVVMNFGVLHLARPERAMAEAARVLMPGGRYACTAWARPEEGGGVPIRPGRHRGARKPGRRDTRRTAVLPLCRSGGMRSHAARRRLSRHAHRQATPGLAVRSCG